MIHPISVSVYLKIPPHGAKDPVDIVAIVYYHAEDSKFVIRTNYP
jgi:hypothetical protein